MDYDHVHVNHERAVFGHLKNQPISKIAPYGSLLLTISACVLAILRLYFLDIIVIPKAYPKRLLSQLTDGQRRSFVNHHVAAATKVLLIIITAYPFIAIAAGKATPSTPFFAHSKTTLGDVLVFSTQIFTVMYIFELFYKDKVSPISSAHHVGAIIIAQAALAMTINWKRESDAIYEFILCFFWGLFDVLAELWPHIAMIVYRVYHDDHALLRRIFYATMALELIGTIVETAVVMWLFGSLWSKWAMALKVITPFLHLLFSAAQLWGAWIFYKMAKGQEREMRKRKTISENV